MTFTSLLVALLFWQREECGEQVFGAAGEVAPGGCREGKRPVTGKDGGGRAGERASDARGADKSREVVEVGVPVHFLLLDYVLVFLLYGAGNGPHINAGCGRSCLQRRAGP